MTDPVNSDEVEPVYENGYASLIPFYTTVESQVKIRNEPFVLPCNENVNMWADYVLDPSEYTKETIDFHYLVSDRTRYINDPEGYQVHVLTILVFLLNVLLLKLSTLRLRLCSLFL